MLTGCASMAQLIAKNSFRAQEFGESFPVLATTIELIPPGSGNSFVPAPQMLAEGAGGHRASTLHRSFELGGPCPLSSLRLDPPKWQRFRFLLGFLKANQKGYSRNKNYNPYPRKCLVQLPQLGRHLAGRSVLFFSSVFCAESLGE